MIRGMADYKDGTRRKDWQQYAALMAAAVLRTIVEQMTSNGLPITTKLRMKTTYLE